ncbi:MAG: class I poly(R)-hydroxyalkanoic acid synthase [Rickettsiales bacterium]|nr:class I poly(R)-hydroxyalkanoic acid synthase [Rickettsiales bacterium]
MEDQEPTQQGEGGKQSFRNSIGMHNTMQILQNSAELLKKYFQILEYLVQDKEGVKEIRCAFDSSKMSNAMATVICNVFSDPDKAILLQHRYVKEFLKIIDYTIEKVKGEHPEPLYEADIKDRRFQHESWYLNIYFDFLKQTYLMSTEWLEEIISQAKGIDQKTKSLAEFFIRQFVNAIAPTNFLFTNPQVLQETIGTNFTNLVDGMNNLLEDLDKYKNIFDITRTDFSAFKVGDNIACTSGQVVYRNEFMELIYYTPSKKQAHDVPMLIIPPWINKYYILDLSPKNSFVKWLVNQDISVFLISWVNPKEEFRDLKLEDYVNKAMVVAIEFILKRFNKNKLNLLSYCVGGTLTTMLLAYLAKHKKEDIIGTATFFATLVDFSDAGEISVFIDEDQVNRLEKCAYKKGYFDGDLMNLTFSVLKANDMIWFFIVNNYLMGKEPLPFDLLYWNADSTRFPAKMYSSYLRNMYLENNLIKPNKIVINNTALDVREIKTPCHFVAAYEDHITPWKSIYRATNVLTCPCKFTLSGSGHVAGIINPADSNKYNYWTSNSKNFPKNPKEWLRTAKKNSGSWWPYWGRWLVKYSGGKVSTGSLNKIADNLAIGKAPGSYVLQK